MPECGSAAAVQVKSIVVSFDQVPGVWLVRHRPVTSRVRDVDVVGTRRDVVIVPVAGLATVRRLK